MAYAGVSNPTYGTLTVGRQQSLELDNMAVYDPQLLSYAFSLIGYSGAFAGAGFTEDARWDNSIKYIYQYGPFHAAGMYTNGGWDTAIFSGAYGANVGFTWKGLSVDAVYQHENSGVSAVTACFCDEVEPEHPRDSVILPSAVAARRDVTGNKCELDQLNGTIGDLDMWSVMAKYTYEFCCCCGGGLKDDKPEPGDKLTLYAGYEHMSVSNPNDPVLLGTATPSRRINHSPGTAPVLNPGGQHATTIGGYILANVNNTNFDTNRVWGLWWTGARYEMTNGLTFSAAYYRLDQNGFLTGLTPTTCVQATINNTTAKANNHRPAHSLEMWLPPIAAARSMTSPSLSTISSTNGSMFMLACNTATSRAALLRAS